MGIIQSFERRLQGAVGNTFARLFGGSVHPSEVISALQAEAGNHLDHQGGRTIAPNRFTVRLGPTDRQGIGEETGRVSDALSETIKEFLTEQGWDTFGDIEVDFEESGSLHTGQFRITSLVDPDAGRRRRAARQQEQSRQSDNGARQMTQSPDPYRQGQPAQPYPARQPYPPQQPQPPYPGQGYPPPQEPQQPYYDQGYPQQPGHPQQPGYGQQGYEQPGYEQGGYYADQQGYEYDDYQRYPDVVAVLRADDGSGRQHQLQRGSNVVGRGQEAAFRLPDTSVSRRHLDIYFDGHIAVMHDLGSTNGTTVNGSSVQTWQLADGDVIRLGHSSIIYNQHG